MRIAYVQNMRLPTEKAHGYQIMKTCEALAKAGAEVSLVVPDRKTPIMQDAFSYYEVDRAFDVVRCPVNDHLRSWPGVLKKLAFVLERNSFAKSLKGLLPQAAEAIYTRDPWLAPQLKALTSKPVYLELHAMPAERNIASLSVLDGILCVTRWMEDRIREKLPTMKTAFLPDAVDLSVFDTPLTKEQARANLSIPADVRAIVYGGRFSTMEQGKGLALLDSVVNRIAEQEPDIRLYLVGGTSDEFNKLEGRNPGQNTICTGNVSRPELASYYRAADLLAMPFPDTHHYAFEMSPLKLFEYMASGTPIVASDLPSIRDILDEQNSYFFKPDDGESLKASILDCLHDPQARSKADNAKNTVRNFTWTNRSLSILNFTARI